MKRLPLLTALLLTSLAWGADPQQLLIKFDYAESVLMKSEGAKRVDASANDAARAKLAQARELYLQARRAHGEGRIEEAEKGLNESLRLATGATQMVPSQNNIDQQLRERYNDLLRQVKSYQDWHVDYKGVDPHEKEDQSKMEAELARAQLLAEQGQYQQANELLNNMLGILITKTNVAIGSKTVTYDLNFTSKEEEYRYEIDRNREYERLVPIALTQKPPAEAMKGLMDKMIDKALSLRKDSEAAFAANKVDDAIARMHESTEQFQNALKIVGVR
ncbi:MAG TPA: hypothetical protein VGE50_08200 [Gammaproteobacteria bacterium]